MDQTKEFVYLVGSSA